MIIRNYHLLCIVAILLILLSLFVAHTDTLDLHLSDIYLVLSGVQTLRTVALFLLLLWLLYLFTHRFLYSKALTSLHIFITLSATLLITACLFYYAAYAKTYITIYNSPLRLLLPLLIIATLLSQLLYIINLLLGVLRRVN